MTNIVLIIFTFVLLFSPLAFGTVEQWSLTIMETCSFLALFFLVLQGYRNKDLSFYNVPGFLPLLFFSAYMLVQLIPLPSQLVNIISPATYALYKNTVLIDEPGAWISLSISKKATLLEFFRFSAYAAFYIVTVQLLSQKGALKRTVLIIIALAAFLSFFGIIQHILWNNKIYWVKELTYGGVPFGPYVNRNHYAGLMDMLFPVAVGLFLFYKPHVSYTSFREKIAEIFNLQRTNIYILLGFCAVLIGTSVFLTLSRSGIIALCLSMIFFGMMVIGKGANRKRGLIIISIFVLIALSVGWFGWAPILERFKELNLIRGDIADYRPVIWKDSGNIMKEFFVTGTGFGSFISVYPLYRTLSTNAIVDHAHNDYIELITDGGIPAFLIMMWFLLALFYKSYRTFLKRHELYSFYIYIGSITGLLSILLHSATDFNLHIGANGLYFFFLAGLAVSAANTRLREGLHDTYLKRVQLPFKQLMVFTLVLLSVSLICNLGILAGNRYFSSVRDIKPFTKFTRSDLLSIKDALSKASLFDPLEARYYSAAANMEVSLADYQNALLHYRKAVRLNPVNSEYLQRTGLLLAEMKRYEAADKFLYAGILYDAGNPVRYKQYARWLLSAGRKADGLNIIRTAISLEPKKTRDYITLMVINNISDEEIPGALPEKVIPHLLFAEYLFKIGNDARADEEYRTALQYVSNEDSADRSYFYAVYGYFMKKGLYDDALKVMRKALEYLPHDAGVRLTAAELYEKMGITYRAIEEYRRALIIDPKNENAKKRLDILLSKTKGHGNE